MCCLESGTFTSHTASANSDDDFETPPKEKRKKKSGF